jgi:glutaminase
MLRLEPNRTNDRQLRLDPKVAKSNTESEEANRAIPYTLIDDPNRARLRMLNEEPKRVASRTES